MVLVELQGEYFACKNLLQII